MGHALHCSSRWASPAAGQSWEADLYQSSLPAGVWQRPQPAFLAPYILRSEILQTGLMYPSGNPAGYPGPNSGRDTKLDQARSFWVHLQRKSKASRQQSLRLGSTAAGQGGQTDQRMHTGAKVPGQAAGPHHDQRGLAAGPQLRPVQSRQVCTRRRVLPGERTACGCMHVSRYACHALLAACRCPVLLQEVTGRAQQRQDCVVQVICKSHVLPVLVGLLAEGSPPICQAASAKVVSGLAAAPVAPPEREAAAEQLANTGVPA